MAIPGIVPYMAIAAQTCSPMPPRAPTQHCRWNSCHAACTEYMYYTVRGQAHNSTRVLGTIHTDDVLWFNQVDLVLPKPTSLEIKQYLHGMGADTFKPGLLSNPSSGRASRSSTRSPVGVGPTDATHVDQDATSSAAAGAAAGIAQRRDLQRLTGSKGYSIDETKAILTIINKNVLAGMSPRAMKRLLNHYRLAKYIYLQQVCCCQSVLKTHSCTLPRYLRTLKTYKLLYDPLLASCLRHVTVIDSPSWPAVADCRAQV